MIYVGTCGYSYKDWIGPFYPGKTRQGEMLSQYARCFCAVEIDASYYGVLPPETVARMNARTPTDFRFCFKVPSTVTHPSDTGSAHVHPDAKAFVQSVAPVVGSGKFGCALMQFPNAFRSTDAATHYFHRVVGSLEPLPLVAEFRNREWQTPATHEMLSDLGVGWCNVDQPRYDSLMRPSSDATSPVGYVRFHGRNAAQWWTGDNTTRYDYDYQPEELEPWIARVAEIDERVETVFAFFNNHARGNAPRNAELFLDLLRERYGEAAAEILADRGPRAVQETLFDA